MIEGDDGWMVQDCFIFGMCEVLVKVIGVCVDDMYGCFIDSKIVIVCGILFYFNKDNFDWCFIVVKEIEDFVVVCFCVGDVMVMVGIYVLDWVDFKIELVMFRDFWKQVLVVCF